MDIDRSIPIEQRIELLNKMFENEIDHDYEGPDVIYIIVDYNKSIEYLWKLMPEDSLEYLKTYMDDPLDDGFDIVPLWGFIHEPNIEIWCDLKQKKFYIAKWYHKLLHILKSKQNEILRAIKRKLKRIYYWRVNFKNKRKEKQAIRQFIKQHQ